MNTSHEPCVAPPPRVAIVTGGMTGIGLACVKALRADGCRVAVGARRADEADSVTAFRAALGADVLLHPLDVRQAESVSSFVAAVTDQIGPIDVLVNNAGVSTHQHVSVHDADDWERVIDINLNGPFRVIRACLPDMIARKWGRIINIASTAARTAVPDSAAYCASKSGLLGLSRAVALEGAPHGVTCVTVSPTWVETDMMRASAKEAAAHSGDPAEAHIAAIAASNPQNRLVQPSEIGALVAFLASDAAPGLTMEDIQVNAGAHW